jgi:hypothetical protein
MHNGEGFRTDGVTLYLAELAFTGQTDLGQIRPILWLGVWKMLQKLMDQATSLETMVAIGCEWR